MTALQGFEGRTSRPCRVKHPPKTEGLLYPTEILLKYLDSYPVLNYYLCKDISMTLDKETLIDLICKHCEFYKESDKDLECGAYKILKGLLEKKIITPKAAILGEFTNY